MDRLANRVAIITGGSNGIGRVTVDKFLSEGASVAIWDIDAEAGEKVVNELIANSIRSKYH